MIENMRLHHIGYAVSDIDISMNLFKAMGYTGEERIYDPLQKSIICFMSKSGEPMVELIAPAEEKSPVKGILNKQGVCPYHCCYEVDDIHKAIKELRKLLFIKLFNPTPAKAIENKEICYLFNKNFGLIELVQK